MHSARGWEIELIDEESRQMASVIVRAPVLAKWLNDYTSDSKCLQLINAR